MPKLFRAFVHLENIKRYRALLVVEKDAQRRKQIETLLKREEKAAQADAELAREKPR